MSLGTGAALDASMADRAALQAALSAYFACHELAALGGAYVERSLIPGALLWVHAWRPLPHLVSWAAVLAWAGCTTLAVSFDVLAWRARQRLLAALPGAQAVVRLHFAQPPAVPPSFLLVQALVPLGAVLWAHALRPGLLPPALLGPSSRAWLAVVVFWFGVKKTERSRG